MNDTLEEGLRVRGLHDLADGVSTCEKAETAASRYDDAAFVPPRAPLSRERIDARNAAISASLRAKPVPPLARVDCPTCATGNSHVVPYDGDGAGNVTVWRCLTCKTNFVGTSFSRSVPDPTPATGGDS